MILISNRNIYTYRSDIIPREENSFYIDDKLLVNMNISHPIYFKQTNCYFKYDLEKDTDYNIIYFCYQYNMDTVRIIVDIKIEDPGNYNTRLYILNREQFDQYSKNKTYESIINTTQLVYSKGTIDYFQGKFHYANKKHEYYYIIVKKEKNSSPTKIYVKILPGIF